jgi:hypothetical protein
MAPLTMNAFANVIKGYAIAIGVAFAIWFVWMWWVHRQREHAQDRAARARAVYSTWLRAALNHPELAEPVLGGPAEIIRYKLFVASLLSAACEILVIDDTSHWRETLAHQLFPHRSYLASRDFLDGGYADCTPAVRKLIDQLTRQPTQSHADPTLRVGEPLRHAGSRANTG